MPDRPISVLMNTLNAERYLQQSLRSVAAWASEVIVVDMHSDDRTREIAENLGARVVLHEREASVVYARKFAVEQAANDWIFVLDADELVPLKLANRIQHVVNLDEADVYRVPRENHIIGHVMTGGGSGVHQDYQMRLFRKNSMEFPARLHKDFAHAPNARVSQLPVEPGGAIVHFTYRSVRDLIERINRYTDEEALSRRDRKSKPRWKYVRDALKEFRGRYYRLGAKNDGWVGFYLSLMMVFYQLAIQAKIDQLQSVGTEAEIENSYLQLASEIADQHYPKI